MVMNAIDLKNQKKTETTLEDPKINVKLKLSALWVTNMFIFIYVDYFGLYIPGVLENIIKGEVAHTGLEVSQAFLLFGLILMIIPSLMIFLSLALPAKANRWTNIIVGIGYSIVLVGGLVGESWGFYIFGTIIELVLIALIVWYAWNWPTLEVNTKVGS